MAVAWAANADRPGPWPTDEASENRTIGVRDAAGLKLEDRATVEPLRAVKVSITDGTPASSGAATTAEPHVTLKPVAADSAVISETPIGRALRIIDESQARYAAVRDYVCTFSKQERINGRMTTPHVMLMKVRTQPRSVYFKFRQPVAGREAIFIEGRNDGKVLAHDVGLGRLIAGTLCLDPTGPRAMEDNRHPITHAGIGPLLDTIEARWSTELDPAESLVAFREGEVADSRPCTIIETTHPRRQSNFMFYQVRLYIDRDLGLPVRFQAYDWPARPDAAPEIVEDYTYGDLELNVGLGDVDFDVSNAAYAFGRF
jgi:hypothetical protein